MKNLRRWIAVLVITIVVGAAGWFIVPWLVHGGWPASCPTGDSLPPHIAQVDPPDGAQVSWASSVCVGLLDQRVDALACDPSKEVRLYIDGVNRASRKGALINIGDPGPYQWCYSSNQSLLIGWHTAKVIYSNIKGDKIQYMWRFQVKD